jgi:hypothetical protein
VMTATEAGGIPPGGPPAGLLQPAINALSTISAPATSALAFSGNTGWKWGTREDMCIMVVCLDDLLPEGQYRWGKVDDSIC